ncbi:hypothetical protein [Bailinhaonella thermotolerans]|uniref:Exo-alpha-sialidase n=1 Tax=Bailinhaonella thermotolerans TaxID=1070861 RepID=A0A3A4B7K1_9ACTN|nr:hypothetical protein [Bailinhaonella thermotolerans]RJL33474.1 hypothetical protein D5H75_11890 [Bailinhaonella thermotolerans]
MASDPRDPRSSGSSPDDADSEPAPPSRASQEPPPPLEHRPPGPRPDSGSGADDLTSGSADGAPHRSSADEPPRRGMPYGGRGAEDESHSWTRPPYERPRETRPRHSRTMPYSAPPPDDAPELGPWDKLVATGRPRPRPPVGVDPGAVRPEPREERRRPVSRGEGAVVLPGPGYRPGPAAEPAAGPGGTPDAAASAEPAAPTEPIKPVDSGEPAAPADAVREAAGPGGAKPPPDLPRHRSEPLAPDAPPKERVKGTPKAPGKGRKARSLRDVVQPAGKTAPAEAPPAAPGDKLVASGPPRRRALRGGDERRSPFTRRTSPPPPRPPRRRRGSGLVVPLLVLAIVLVGAGAGLVVFNWMERPQAPARSGLTLAAGEVTPIDQSLPAIDGARGDGARQALRDVGAVGSAMVAVGSDTASVIPRPLFLVSQDSGRSWRMASVTGATGGEPVAATADQVAGGPLGWVAVSSWESFAGMWTSADGRSWKALPPSALGAFRPGDHVADLAATPTGFVAVGRTAAAPGADRASPVAWFSPDGRSWRRIEAGSIGRPELVGPLNDVVARGNVVVALSESPGDSQKSIVLRSVNGGRDWQPVAAQIQNLTPQDGGLAAVKDGFVLIPAIQRPGGANAPLPVWCSSDGERWQACGSMSGLGYDGAGVRAVAGNGASAAAVVEVGLGRFAVYTSADGKRWNRSHDLGQMSGGQLNGLAVASDGGLAVVGDQSAADVDNRLVLWQASRGRPAEQVQAGGVEGLRRPWRRANRLVAGDGQLVLVGGSHGDAAIWTSPGGGSWTRAAHDPGTFGGDGRQELLDVARGPRGWLAVGSTSPEADRTAALMVTSADGKAWRRVGSPALQPTGDDNRSLAASAVAAGAKGYVIAGTDNASGAESPALWHSADLRGFTRVTGLPSGASGVRLHDVAATATGFVAVGGAGSGERETAVVWTSADGRAWTAGAKIVPSGAQETGLRHVVARGDAVTAVGLARRGGDRVPFSAVSSDGGRTWTTHWFPRSGEAEIDDLVATAYGLVAVGASGSPGTQDSAAWTSADGETWERRSPTGTGLSGPGVQRLDGVTVVGEQVVAIGRSTTYTQDHVTLWRSTLRR